MTREREQKRCENCNKLFGQRRLLTTGAVEYPSHFKKRRYCSKICGAVANAAKRKAEKDLMQREAYP